MKKLILSALFAIFSIVSADTINSVSKNPSMAVLGTQRDSATVINPYVIPVAVSGAACNSTTDIVAVTSDHSSQLICQSGSWAPVGGGATGSNTPNGYVRLSNGLIIQWGTTVALSGGLNAGQQLTVTFPTPFPNACVNAVASLNNTTADISITVSSLTNNNFKVSNNSSAWSYNTETGGPVFWQAIGY